MGKGGVKHEAEILNEIQLLLDQQSGIISQFQILKILKKYYSELYADGGGFKKIEREITRRNMVKKIKVNAGNLSSVQTTKTSLLNQLLTLYISPSVPDEEKRSLISTFVKNSIPNLEMPTMKRSISKELFMDKSTHYQKRPETMEFPSIQFRAILLHQFLISTFKTNPFSTKMISDLMPTHLSAQIMRSYDAKLIVLPLISPLKKSYEFEIDVLIPYLRPPFHQLVTKIDAVYNSIIPTAVIEIPFYNINKKYDFINDPSSISDYWILIYSLENQKISQFPVSISTRFERFLTIYFEKLSIREVPFFPYQIERFSKKVGISPEIVSYSIQKILKKKLKLLQCSKESYLESKLFPLNGLLPFLITKSSLIKTPEPKFATSLSTPFKVDGSIECLAKLYAASQLTEEGYIINQRSNFKLFKKQVKKWVSKCSKFSNFFSSLKENKGFNSLIKHEMALLIEEMKFPSFFFSRVDLKPIKTITLEINSENEEDNQPGNENENDAKDDKKEELSNDDDDHQMEILRSTSANFKAESLKQVSRILQSPSLSLIKKSSSKPKLSNLNDIFTKSFPDFTKEQFFNQGESKNPQDNDDDSGVLPFHSLYFQDNDTSFPTAYAIDSPINSDPSNDEIIEPPSIHDSEDIGSENDQESPNRNLFNYQENENEKNNNNNTSFDNQENQEKQEQNYFGGGKQEEENDFGDENSTINEEEENDFKEEENDFGDENSTINEEEENGQENDDSNDEEYENKNDFNDSKNESNTFPVDSGDFFNEQHDYSSNVFPEEENESESCHPDEEEDEFIPDHHFHIDEDSDYEDDIVEYPVLDPSDFQVGTESEFLSLFQVKNRLIDADFSVSVAIEFLKIILSSPSTPKTNDLKLRQTVHFSQKDALEAIWLLSSIDVYQHTNIVKFPSNEWELPLPENSFPRPLFIPYCDNSEENDPTPLKIVWKKVTEIDEEANSNEEGNDVDDDDYDIIDGDDEKGSDKYITFQFKNITFREQISAFKKEKQTFRFERKRFDLPKLPPFDVMTQFKFNPDQIYDQLYNYDPLSQFCFGQYTIDIPNLEKFPCRFIMNLINSAGVFGLSLSDIIHSFGIQSPLECDDIISNVKLLCTMNFICRVPSSRLVPSYTRFIPCNTICKPVNNNKIELVSPHVWLNFDGFINEEVKMNLINNISTFIFAHEFCDFNSLIEEFPYVSPYDLCLILQALECDEIIFSQYFQKVEPSLLEDEENIPIPPFESIEKFLIVLDYQRKNCENNNISYHRILRTNRSMLPNLCVLNNC